MLGGTEQRDNLLAWAGANYTPPQVEDLNRRLGDSDLYEGALQQLQTAHAIAIGAGGSRPLLTGDAPAPAAAGFANATDYLAAITQFKAGGGADANLGRRIAETSETIVDAAAG